MFRTVMIVVALAILAAAGVVEGMRSDRWGKSEDRQAAAARLQNVPRAFGHWTSTETVIEKKVLDRAEAVGSVARLYKNTVTGTEVSTLLLCGPSGPIASHTPDVCYSGIGYKMIGGEVSRAVKLPDGTSSTYWTARFDKGTGEPPLLVSWAWGADGSWSAAKAPRAEFFQYQTLYKLYASRGPTTAERDGTPATGPDPTQEFLTEFLPEVKKALAPPPQ